LRIEGSSTSSKTGVFYDYGRRHPAASSHDRGHERAEALCRHAEGPHSQLQAPELIQADVLDDISIGDAIAGADAVINLVGILTETARQTYRAIHVEGARRVALAAQQLQQLRDFVRGVAVCFEEIHVPYVLVDVGPNLLCHFICLCRVVLSSKGWPVATTTWSSLSSPPWLSLFCLCSCRAPAHRGPAAGQSTARAGRCPRVPAPTRLPSLMGIKPAGREFVSLPAVS